MIRCVSSEYLDCSELLLCSLSSSSALSLLYTMSPLGVLVLTTALSSLPSSSSAKLYYFPLYLPYCLSIHYHCPYLHQRHHRHCYSLRQYLYVLHLHHCLLFLFFCLPSPDLFFTIVFILKGVILILIIVYIILEVTSCSCLRQFLHFTHIHKFLLFSSSAFLLLFVITLFILMGDILIFIIVSIVLEVSPFSCLH